MKKIAIVLCLVLVSLSVNAQDRSPAGAKSEREVRGNASDRDRDVKAKEGKNSISKDAKSAANEIKSINSADGKGEVMTPEQRNEVARQLGDQQTKAAAESKTADAKYFESEKNKIKNQ